MRRYIYKIALAIVALIVVNVTWGQDVTWQTLNGGITTTQSINGYYKLTGNTTLNADDVVIEANGDLTLDLNGYTLSRKDGTTGFILSCNNHTMTIMDTSVNKTGKITGGRGDRGGCALVSGKLILNGGTIEDCISTDNDLTKAESDTIHNTTQGCGGAFFINQNSTLIMNEGSAIKNCRTNIYTTSQTGPKIGDKTIKVYGLGGAVFVDAETGSNPGTFEMNGGVISGCKASYGGAVYVHKSLKSGTKVNGIFKLNNGIINDNQSYYHGPGVYVKGEFTMNGGKIENNKPQNLTWSVPSADDLPEYGGDIAARVYGGGVYILGDSGSPAKFNMLGGTISNNIAASGGGVMVWENSIFNLDGTNAIIESNYAVGEHETSGLGNGGAVYVYNAEFNFKNGTLQNNRARRYGGAVNINAKENVEAKLTLTGSCKVIGNIANYGGGLSQEQGLCNMSLNHQDIEIYNNKAKKNGGGLFIEKGTLNIGEGVEISNNNAGGRGGGASIYVQRITGDITANINGTIKENKAGESGGGLDLYANIDNPDKNKVNVSLNKGNLSLNTAKNGAGIYIDINEDNSTATMTVGTQNDMPEIDSNIATSNGGAIGMTSGTFIVYNGSFTNNSAANGGAIYLGNGTFTIDGNTTFTGNKASENGGGIYQGGGTFTVNAGKTITVGSDGNANTAGQSGGGIYCAGTFTVNGTANVKYNTAHDGAGISVKNGAVTLAAGEISNNKATQFGGGLYVHNEGNEQNAKFQGGTFTKNQAQAGGGICAIGKINLTLASNVNENTAVNGGGIYMADGVDMSFGQGIIKANKAESSASIISAKEGTNETVSGVGGGIFMADNTSLEFTKTSSLGIYGNAASNAAADIFANGNNTKIVLPNTKGMDLTGFDVPGNELYWVEDYVKGETVNGKTASRYEDALKDRSLPIVKINFDDNEASKTITDYICLDLGYDLVFVTLKALGLLNEDQAKIDLFYRVKDNSTDVARYTGVLFTGIANNGAVVREIGLPSGDWQFKPSDWFSERYGNEMKVSPSPYPDADGFIKVTREGLNKGQTGATEDKTITFTFVPKESDIKYDNIIESHHRVVNYMGTGIK